MKATSKSWELNESNEKPTRCVKWVYYYVGLSSKRKDITTTIYEEKRRWQDFILGAKVKPQKVNESLGSRFVG